MLSLFSSFFKFFQSAMPISSLIKSIFFLCMGYVFASFAEEENPYPPLKIFVESLHAIESKHPSPPPRDTIISGAIQGMLSQVDPYSYLMNKKQAEDFYRATKSSYGGIGVSVGFKDKKTIITSVFQNSPAFKKGLKAGDVITHIEGKPLEEEPFSLTAQRMGGKIGKHLKITISRKGSKLPLNFSIPFSRIKIPSVQGRPIGNNFFYVKISSFRENTFQELKKILKAKKCKNKNYLCSRVKKGLILDLRQNAGGIVDQALLIADLFIKEGILTSIKSRNDEKVFRAKKIGTLEPLPMIILIDEYSASASEILAASLQDNDRALLIGSTSFGKGSIQSVIKLDQGYSLKMTVSHYYTPNGRIIEQKGVEPHIRIKSIVFDQATDALFDFTSKFYRKYDYPKKTLGKKEISSRLKTTVTEKSQEKKDESVELAVSVLDLISS